MTASMTASPKTSTACSPSSFVVSKTNEGARGFRLDSASEFVVETHADDVADRPLADAGAGRRRQLRVGCADPQPFKLGRPLVVQVAFHAGTESVGPEVARGAERTVHRV